MLERFRMPLRNASKLGAATARNVVWLSLATTLSAHNKYALLWLQRSVKKKRVRTRNQKQILINHILYHFAIVADCTNSLQSTQADNDDHSLARIQQFPLVEWCHGNRNPYELCRRIWHRLRSN